MELHTLFGRILLVQLARNSWAITSFFVVNALIDIMQVFSSKQNTV
jgi:hypothetical protein